MTRVVQAELERAWRFENELRTARALGSPPERVSEILDELDTIRLMTNSERLRRRCAALIEEGSGAVVVAGFIA